MHKNKKLYKTVSSTGKNTKNASSEKKKENFSVLPTSVIKKYEPEIFVYKKKRPISHIDNDIKWNLEDAEKAIFLEQMFVERQKENQGLVISFPDQPLSSSIVRGFSRNIDSVNFVQSFAPRYCYVTLKTGSNVKEEISKISKIKFQNGFLKVKIKSSLKAAPTPMPKEVDPSTLYVGNLPPDISIKEVKEHFPKAIRIEVGYSLKKKWRRYALVRYSTAGEAMHAFAVLYDSHIRSTSLVIRFHRVKNWKILEEVETKKELTRLKIKKEKVDEEYEAALRKAQIGSYSSEAFNDPAATLAPAQYPIARPLIDPSMIKKEPKTPEHVDDEGHQNESNWSQHMQYLQYMMMNRPANPEKSQYDQHGMQQQQLFHEQTMLLMQQQGLITDLTPSSNHGFHQKSYRDETVCNAPVHKTSSASLSKEVEDLNKKPQITTKVRSNKRNMPNSVNAISSNMEKNVLGSIKVGPKKIDVMKLPRIPKKRPAESNPDNSFVTNPTDFIDNGSIKKTGQSIHPMTQQPNVSLCFNNLTNQKLNVESSTKTFKKRKRTL